MGELRAALQKDANSVAVEPEAWWEGYADLPYAVSLLWSEGDDGWELRGGVAARLTGPIKRQWTRVM